MTEVEQPPQNGIDLSANEEDESSKARPADIEQDMREMERRKRVEAIMGSKLFREELERIVDSARDGGNTAGILQQLSDIVGGPSSRVANVFKSSNCMLPINDIRGVESMGYAKGEKILRCKLAATFRLLDLNGWTQGLGAQITARLKVDQEYFLVNPYGLLYHEITASSLNKVDMQGQIVEQGTTNFGVNKSHFVLHSAVHAARPDIRCAIYIGCSPVVAISSLKNGLLPLTKDACVLGEVTTYAYSGCLLDEEERNKLVRNLGPNSKVMLLTNHGALCCGETIEEAFFAACHIVQACETQLKLLPVGLDNLVLIPEESRKTVYEQSRRPPEDLEKKFAAATTIGDSNKAEEEAKKEDGGEVKTKVLGQPPKWRVGGAEFEALMRMLDNAGFRTGYIYRHPLIKSEPPKPKNDVELPPAVSSLGYLLEEEELFRQGIWKKGALAKGGDRSRWLNSPNVYQKVEVLETGTPDPKKITKWVAEGSPTHSTPVRIDDPLQFVPVNTNPKEFKRLQQQIKDNRRADKISAGPQSHILEGVTWDEANRIKDATVSQAGDHVVLMGAASKGIIQRGFQHNATVYKAPYAKNPFDNVTDDELNEYKRTVERKKKSIHGEYTDTDFSESEALSSLQTSGAQQQTKQNTTTTTTTAAVSQSEPEDMSEHQVMRIETQQAPVPSQPEVVLSDATLSFINGERSHTAVNRKPPTGRENTQDTIDSSKFQEDQDKSQVPKLVNSNSNSDSPDVNHIQNSQKNSTNINLVNQNLLEQSSLKNCFSTVVMKEMECQSFYQRQKQKNEQHCRKENTECDDAMQMTSDFHNIRKPRNVEDFNTSDKFSSKTLPVLADKKNALDSLKKDFQNSLCLNPPNRQNLNSFNNNLDGYETSPNISPIYDRVYDCNFTSISPSPFPKEKKIYQTSKLCGTPHVCGEILESLQKPFSPLQQNYMGANTLHDLIWNKPFHYGTFSPISITPVDCFTPPLSAARSEVMNSPIKSCHKSRSPYRTLSHFGFNSPQREPQPEHKHVPSPSLSGDKKYIPLRRSVSYEEIFTSPRYMDLCEHCFERLVSMKPEIVQYRTKLRNLTEYRGPLNTPTAIYSEENANEMVQEPVKDKMLSYEQLPLSNESDLDDRDTDSISPVFISHLETVIEVEEDEYFMDSSMANSSCIDKAMSLDYIHEPSHKYLNAPTGLAVMEKNKPENRQGNEVEILNKKRNIQQELFETNANHFDEDELIEDIQNLFTLLDTEEQMQIIEGTETNLNNKEYSVNICEILEFNDWREFSRDHERRQKQQQAQERDVANFVNLNVMSSESQTENMFDDKNEETTMALNVISSETQTENMFDDNKTATFMDFNTISSETQMETQMFEDAKEETHNIVTVSPIYISQNEQQQQDHSYGLTLRDERFRRKLVFKNPWDNRVDYNSNRELISAESAPETPAALSDTESAIYESARQTNSQASKSLENKEEIFTSCSIIYPQASSYFMKSSSREDEEVKSLTSQRTYDITDNATGVSSSRESLLNSNNDEYFIFEENQHLSTDASENQENWLFRSYGSTNIAVDFAIDRTCKQSLRKLTDAHGNDITSFKDYVKLKEDHRHKEDKSNLDVPLAENHELSHLDRNLNQEIEGIENSKSFENRENNLDFNFFPEKSQKEREEEEEEVNKNNTLRADNYFTDHDCNKENHNDLDKNNKIPTNDNDEEYSYLERKILQKINFHQLNKKEEIFEKIEHSIRNKLTPSKMEMRVKEQLLHLYGNDQLKKLDTSQNQYSVRRSRSLTPCRTIFKSKRSSLSPQNKYSSYRRSRSSTPDSHENQICSTKLETNQTFSLPNTQVLVSTSNDKCSNRPSSPLSSPLTKSLSQHSSSSKKRNFILENIRNAAMPRNVNQPTKRFHGNTQAIFCKNPFGPRKTTTLENDLNLNLPKKSLSPLGSNSSNSSPNFSQNVFTFESKLVRGSPKYWVSMAQTPRKSKTTLSPTVDKKKRLDTPMVTKRNNRKHIKKQDTALHFEEKMSHLSLDSGIIDQNIDNPSTVFLKSGREQLELSDYSSLSSPRVDAQMNALGQEIQEIHPRLESYERKVDEFGDRIAKCARHMDECVAAQDELVADQQEVRKRMRLQYLADKVMYRVQTYSLSETED